MPPAMSRIPSFWPQPPAPFCTRAAAPRRPQPLRGRAEAASEAWRARYWVNGRFEMIVLHVVRLVARLQAEGDEGQELARALEAFVADVDDACRRIGIGDMGVPRHVKKATVAVLERGAAIAAR